MHKHEHEDPTYDPLENMGEEREEEYESRQELVEEPVTQPSTARPTGIASIMEAIVIKEQALANAVLEVEELLDQAIGLVSKYKKSVLEQTSAIQETLS
jgi:hypothetical protein